MNNIFFYENTMLNITFDEQKLVYFKLSNYHIFLYFREVKRTTFRLMDNINSLFLIFYSREIQRSTLRLMNNMVGRDNLRGEENRQIKMEEQINEEKEQLKMEIGRF